MKVGDKLKNLLENNEMKVSELSKRSKVPATTLYSIIKRNNKKIDPIIANQICRALNVPLKELISEEEDFYKISWDSEIYKEKLLTSYELLNEKGKEKVIDYISDLTKISEYIK